MGLGRGVAVTANEGFFFQISLRLTRREEGSAPPPAQPPPALPAAASGRCGAEEAMPGEPSAVPPPHFPSRRQSERANCPRPGLRGPGPGRGPGTGCGGGTQQPGRAGPRSPCGAAPRPRSPRSTEGFGGLERGRPAPAAPAGGGRAEPPPPPRPLHRGGSGGLRQAGGGRLGSGAGCRGLGRHFVLLSLSLLLGEAGGEPQRRRTRAIGCQAGEAQRL